MCDIIVSQVKLLACFDKSNYTKIRKVIFLVLRGDISEQGRTDKFLRNGRHLKATQPQQSFVDPNRRAGTKSQSRHGKER